MGEWFPLPPQLCVFAEIINKVFQVPFVIFKENLKRIGNSKFQKLNKLG
jgi:hypothetical protein